MGTMGPRPKVRSEREKGKPSLGRRILRHVKNFFTFPFFLVGGVCYFMAPCLLLYQTVLWLRSGNWTRIRVTTPIEFLAPGSSVALWIKNPKSLFGLNELIMDMPLVIILIPIGLFLGVSIVSIGHKIQTFGNAPEDEMNRGGRRQGD